MDPDCSELEEWEEMGGGVSPLQDKHGVITPNLHTVTLLRLQDTPQLHSQDTQLKHRLSFHSYRKPQTFI